MKRNVPGAGPRARGDEGWVVRHEFSTRRVEAKDEDPVNALVGHGYEPAARIKNSVVGMRAGLLLAIRTLFAGQVYQITAQPQTGLAKPLRPRTAAGSGPGDLRFWRRYLILPPDRIRVDWGSTAKR